MKRIFISIVLSIAFSCGAHKNNIANVVIVDIGNFKREVIAKQIAIVDSLNPKVIALDLQFISRNDESDSIFVLNLNRFSNLVLASVIDGDYEGINKRYDSLIVSIPQYKIHARTGFTNALLDDDEFQTLSRFSIAENVDGKTEFHFAVQTALAFDSLQTTSFIESNEKIVKINYSGGVELFSAFSVQQILERKISKSDIEGKIVLFGSFSPFKEDRFFSPLNSKTEPYTPDMYGVVYLANIIVQILDFEKE